MRARDTSTERLAPSALASNASIVAVIPMPQPLSPTWRENGGRSAAKA
jgi:hypothetical protein